MNTLDSGQFGGNQILSQNQYDIFEIKIKENIKILNRLSIDTSLGSFFSFEYLESLGFDINYYTGRIPVIADFEYYKIQIGSFVISRHSFNNAHIETLKIK